MIKVGQRWEFIANPQYIYVVYRISGQRIQYRSNDERRKQYACLKTIFLKKFRRIK